MYMLLIITSGINTWETISVIFSIIPRLQKYDLCSRRNNILYVDTSWIHKSTVYLLTGSRQKRMKTKKRKF